MNSLFFLYCGHLLYQPFRKAKLSAVTEASLTMSRLPILNPTPRGLSNYSTLLDVFHEYGFISAVYEPSGNTTGPCSWNRASIDEQPGPPVNQIKRGSSEGFCWLSKNTQCIEPWGTLMQPEQTPYLKSIFIMSGNLLTLIDS